MFDVSMCSSISAFPDVLFHVLEQGVFAEELLSCTLPVCISLF